MSRSTSPAAGGTSVAAVRLLAALLSTLVAAPAAAQPPDAAALARAGRHVQAIGVFEQRVARSPGDIDARVWLARLYGWTGRGPEAKRMARLVLEEHPDHVEALVILAGLLMNEADLTGASAVLARAGAVAPGSAEVSAGLARLSWLAGASGRALDLFEQAHRATPGDGDLARRLEDVRRGHAHAVTALVAFERDGRVGPQAGVAASVRLGDRWRADAVLERGERAGRGQQRAGAAIAVRLSPGVTARAGLLAGPGNTAWSRREVEGSLGYARGQLEWSGTARLLTFEPVDATVWSPGLTWRVSDDVSVEARLSLSRTRFRESASETWDRSVLLRTRWRVHHRLWLDGAVASGLESFETLASDRAGRVASRAAAGGLRLDLPSLSSVSVTVERQRRSTGAASLRVAAGFTQRF
jgi:tetratricopeptide (TPR) repeat protein